MDKEFKILTIKEERISTMRYELIEEKGIFKRQDITNLEYINFLKGNYENLELGKIDINRERMKFIHLLINIIRGIIDLLMEG